MTNFQFGLAKVLSGGIIKIAKAPINLPKVEKTSKGMNGYDLKGPKAE